MVEVVWKRLEWTLSPWSARHHRPAGHRLVPVERLGLHTEEGHHDDQTVREAAQHSTIDELLLSTADPNNDRLLTIKLRTSLSPHPDKTRADSRTVPRSFDDAERSLNYLFRPFIISIHSYFTHRTTIHHNPISRHPFKRFINSAAILVSNFVSRSVIKYFPCA